MRGIDNMGYNLPGYDLWKTDYGEDEPEYEFDNDKIEIDEDDECLHEK